MANENYEGFDLTIYNLFTLLREMYYTRGETETNFLSKSGGTLGGSLTIQGNLTVQGNSYKIDTENLVVKDYTITLAKDNDSALLSMVGMVVPKYDGTNYGFFGWDADGYAYVGDLTDYDGSSAITLAENTSLQKIATIKDTATGTTSDDIMVYDQTNKVFKKAPSGRYVIEDNELVASNDNKALYNLGAFDVYPYSNNNNQVQRKTGYQDLSELSWTLWQDTNSSAWYFHASFSKDQYYLANEICHCKHPIYSAVYYGNPPFTTDNRIAYSGSTLICRTTSTSVLPSGILEFEVVNGYVEDVIPNQPLLNLDSNGCNFLREEWEKGLNLWNKETTLNANITYSQDLPSGTYTYSFTLNANAPQGTVIKIGSTNIVSEAISVGFHSYTFTTTGETLTHIQYGGTSTQVMLNSGTHAYPYQEYNGAIVREKDITPVLLWENSSPNSDFAGQTITTADMSKYKYIEIVYKYSATSAYSKCVFKTVYEASTTFFISSANAQHYGELIVSRGFTFTNSTTLTADKGTKISIGSSSPADDNNKIVPIAIYGTNVL